MEYSNKNEKGINQFLCFWEVFIYTGRWQSYLNCDIQGNHIVIGTKKSVLAITNYQNVCSSYLKGTRGNPKTLVVHTH